MDIFLKLFPFLHVIILIAGGLILLFVKRRYQKVRNYELIIVFILFFILVSIFTEQGLDMIKELISFIQVD